MFVVTNLLLSVLSDNDGAHLVTVNIIHRSILTDRSVAHFAYGSGNLIKSSVADILT